MIQISRFLSQREIEYVCKLLHESFGFPAFYRSDDPAARIQSFGVFPRNPFYPEAEDMLAIVALQSEPTILPVIRTTAFLENYIVLGLQHKGTSFGTVIAGPSVYDAFTEESTAMLLYDNQVPWGDQDEWRKYAAALPVVPKMRLLHAGRLLYYLIYKKPLDVNEVLAHSLAVDPAYKLAEHLDVQVSAQRESGVVHHSPLLEKSLFEAIKRGDKEECLKIHATMTADRFGVLSNRSQLRNKKNLAVSGITLATRAAIDGGLLWEAAYTLSDLHIRHIEELTENDQVERATVDAFADFADRVRQSREQRVSKPVALCLNHMFNRLYEPISLQDLAELTGLNASYLSQLFKKETGMTVSECIAKERIEEAKRLLALTDLPLLEISARLHFNDQSYFTKVFKKFAGVTPKHFRTLHGLA